VEYQDKVVLKTFDNLRIKDNPSKYKNSIIDAIKDKLEEQNFSKMVDEYINKKKNGEKNQENQKEAETFFSESLEYVLEQFKYIEDNLESLNRRNTKYATTAKSRIAFLLNEEVDIEGKIIDLLKNIAKTEHPKRRTN
jgi:endo-alpha-1,4-polygalactosaminidase (GH114 family)